ncbi:MAG TPA: cation diffusion facilitator family transporter [bacterium]|nr:cation diffusion facilitator family transporter [bacterium]HNS48907.1 cation diffusion facilitator family transporter [bacterium]
MERLAIGRRNIIWALAINLALFAFKFYAGLAGMSQAMVTDAFHTLSDILATSIVFFGLMLGGRPSDPDHPYGHGKFETMAAGACSLFLVAAGFLFIYEAVLVLLTRHFHVPTFLPLLAAVFSIGLKEFLYQYTIRVARRINSTALRADAWHHRSDAFSSIPAFLGILGARLGLPFLDPLAAILVAVFVIHVGLVIGQDVFSELVESSVDGPTLARIRAVAGSVEGVRHIHDLGTRMLGPSIIVDLHILVDGNLSVQRGHEIADRVEHRLKEEVPAVNRVTVHVDPIGRLT